MQLLFNVELLWDDLSKDIIVIVKIIVFGWETDLGVLGFQA